MMKAMSDIRNVIASVIIATASAVHADVPTTSPSDAATLFQEGLACSKGIGVPQDYAKAAAYYREAEEAGNAPAMNNLGRLYAEGKGVPQDYAQAMKLYRHAADAS